MNIELTKQYTTRNNLPVKLYDIVDENQTYPVMGAYLFYDEADDVYKWVAESWSLDGSISNLSNQPYDLVEVPNQLQQDELIIVWDNVNLDRNDFTQYQLRRFVSNTSDGIGYVTSTKFNDLANTEIWDNCVRLSEFKL